MKIESLKLGEHPRRAELRVTSVGRGALRFALIARRQFRGNVCLCGNGIDAISLVIAN